MFVAVWVRSYDKELTPHPRSNARGQRYTQWTTTHTNEQEPTLEEELATLNVIARTINAHSRSAEPSTDGRSDDKEEQLMRDVAAYATSDGSIAINRSLPSRTRRSSTRWHTSSSTTPKNKTSHEQPAKSKQKASHSCAGTSFVIDSIYLSKPRKKLPPMESFQNAGEPSDNVALSTSRRICSSCSQ